MLWIAKALTQSALAALPYGEELNYRLQRRGSPASVGEFLDRVGKAIAFIERIREDVDVRNQRILEIGTGWDGLHTLMLAALGAREVITFDHVAHLRFIEMKKVLAALKPFSARLAAVYGDSEQSLRERLEAWDEEPDLQRLLRAMNITYRAPEDAAESGLETQSVDIVYSFLVLSFVPPEQLRRMAAETRRVLRQGGLSIHHIRMVNPYETLNGGDEVRYLKYSNEVWKLICDNSIQRNNRVRASTFLELFAGEGTQLVWSAQELKAGNLERVSRMKVAAPFKSHTKEDLATTAISMIVRHGIPTPPA